MTERFKNIGIIGKPADPRVADTVARLSEHLIASGRRVLVERESLGLVDVAGVESVHRADLGEACDLAVAVGGDGTLLYAARALVDYEVPLLGVNRGRLGFLVDISPGNLEEIDTVLAGHYIEDARMLLTAEVRRGDQVLSSGLAMNDVVLLKWNTARMIEFETFVDGELLNSLRSDGLIIATPTGSTAYSLAGGGPIMHPNVGAVVMVPICPHTLSDRPIVIHAGSRIEIGVHADSYRHVRVSCDGQADMELSEGSRIVVQQKAKRIRLLHPPQYRYFEILRAKLRWGDQNLT